MLDPGHTDKHPGALGAAGEYEVTYNDALLKELISELKRDPTVEVLVSRTPGEEIELADRAAKANKAAAELYLSIHHNSVSPENLEDIVISGKPAKVSKEPKSGYALFVSEENPRISDSILFAVQLGSAMEKMGRRPSAYRVYQSSDEDRRLMNRRFGIYQYDTLAVLRGAAMPAVLFEIGFIVDPLDEDYVTRERSRIARHIAQAIQTYRKAVNAGSTKK